MKDFCLNTVSFLDQAYLCLQLLQHDQFLDLNHDPGTSATEGDDDDAMLPAHSSKVNGTAVDQVDMKVVEKDQVVFCWGCNRVPRVMKKQVMYVDSLNC